MASKDKDWYLGHLIRLHNYEGRVYRIYNKYVEEFTRLVSTLKIDPAKPFSFDDYPTTREAVKKALQKIAEEVEVEINTGTRAEWLAAAENNDELVDKILVSSKLQREQVLSFYNRNLRGLEAFQTRKDGNGLGLSDRVWRINDQFKEEIELGIDAALGDGRPAATLSRDVRKLLREPNKLFRRVRDHRGQLVLSKSAKAYHPGRGVYRSSYKNAMRLATTEINMAYRTSDQMRWEQLPFVLGYEIKLSTNHPVHDLCDSLQGKYPKSFKFRGWHPHCRCYATSILCSDEDRAKLRKKILEGGNLSDFRPKGEIRDVPPGFNDWIRENGPKMENWRSKPYFIRDNFKEGEIDKGLLLETNVPKGKTRFKTAAEKEAVQKAWNERRAVRHYGDRVLRYMDGISDIDTTTLASLLKGGDVAAILKEARSLAAKGKEILSLKNLVDPMQVARTFSAAEAKIVDNAVEKTFARWRWEDDIDSLRFLKGKLENEIWLVESRKKYTTWTVARDAYKARLDLIKFKLERAELAESLETALSFVRTSKTKTTKALFSEWDGLVKRNAPISELKKTASKIEKKYKDHLAKEAAKAAKAGGDIAKDVQDFINSPIGRRYGLTAKDLEITKEGIVKLSEDGYSALSAFHQATADELSWSRKYVRTSNSFALNGKLDDVGGGGVNYSTKTKINPLGRDRYGSQMTKKDITDIKNFDKVIEARTCPFDVEIVRMIDTGGLAGQFGFVGLSGKDLANAIKASIGKEVTAHRYLSFSTDIGKNVFTHRNVMWHSRIKKGTKCYFAGNHSESEVVFGRGMRLKITKIDYNEKRDRFEIWADVSE